MGFFVFFSSCQSDDNIDPKEALTTGILTLSSIMYINNVFTDSATSTNNVDSVNFSEVDSYKCQYDGNFEVQEIDSQTAKITIKACSFDLKVNLEDEEKKEYSVPIPSCDSGSIKVYIDTTTIDIIETEETIDKITIKGHINKLMLNDTVLVEDCDIDITGLDNSSLNYDYDSWVGSICGYDIKELQNIDDAEICDVLGL